MKRMMILFFICLIASFSISAQPETDNKKETKKAARKIMNEVESRFLKEKSDSKAAELIIVAKDASIAAYEYLTSQPGYKEAVLKNDKTARKAYKDKMKAEDEAYIALRKKASEVQKVKQDYLISIIPE